MDAKSPIIEGFHCRYLEKCRRLMYASYCSNDTSQYCGTYLAWENEEKEQREKLRQKFNPSVILRKIN